MYYQEQIVSLKYAFIQSQVKEARNYEVLIDYLQFFKSKPEKFAALVSAWLHLDNPDSRCSSENLFRAAAFNPFPKSPF